MSTTAAYFLEVEAIYQNKILPEFWRKKEAAARSGIADDALPFLEFNRSLPSNSDSQDKRRGPVVHVTTTDQAERATFGGGRAGFVSELFLRHAAEAIHRGTHRLSLPEECIQWRKEGEERKVAMLAQERKLANKKSLVLEDAGMPQPITPGSAAPTGFTATVNGVTVTAPTAEALQAVIAALTPATPASTATVRTSANGAGK